MWWEARCCELFLATPLAFPPPLQQVRVLFFLLLSLLLLLLFIIPFLFRCCQETWRGLAGIQRGYNKPEPSLLFCAACSSVVWLPHFSCFSPSSSAAQEVWERSAPSCSFFLLQTSGALIVCQMPCCAWSLPRWDDLTGAVLCFRSSLLSDLAAQPRRVLCRRF